MYDSLSMVHVGSIPTTALMTADLVQQVRLITSPNAWGVRRR